MQNAIWCSIHPEKYFAVQPWEPCPYCPELKVTPLVVRQVTSEKIQPMKGGWTRVTIVVTFGIRDLSVEPTVYCRGEVYIVSQDGKWQMPDSPESTIKDTLLRITNLLVSEPAEFREAISMYARAALGIAQDPNHSQCTVYHL